MPSLEKALAQMFAEWVTNLHAAALLAREKQFRQLLEQIPPEQTVLAGGLR